MSKLYNDFKVQKIDPLGSRLDDVGMTGGVGRMNRLKLRKTKKTIEKIPNKTFREDKIYELSTGKGGKIVSGKKNKKLAIREQKSITDPLSLVQV